MKPTDFKEGDSVVWSTSPDGWHFNYYTATVVGFSPTGRVRITYPLGNGRVARATVPARQLSGGRP